MILNYGAYVADGIALLGKPFIKGYINYVKIYLSWFISLLTGKVVVWGGPFSISIETSAICNLRCPECATGTGRTTREKVLPVGTSLKDILALHQSYAFYCNLYFQGEPFLNKDIFSVINNACSMGYYSVIATNGHFLQEQHCRQIITSGLSRIIISVDGISQDSYQFYRRGGSFERVTTGIRTLTRLKKQLKVSHPLVVIQYLVNKHNEADLDKVEAFARDLGADILEFKSMQVYSSTGTWAYLPDNEKYNRYKRREINKQRRLRCFRLWSHMVYTSDGIVVPCCFDKIPQYAVPRHPGQDKDGWTSEFMMDFRSRILKSDGHPDICRNCIY